MKTMRHLLAPALALLISACGTYSPLSQSNRVAINGIAPAAEVSQNRTFTLMSALEGMVSTSQGSKVESAPETADEREQARLHKALEQYGVNIKAIVGNELQSAIQSRPVLKAKPAGQAPNSTLKLRIDAYGAANRLLKGYGPDLGLQGQLIGPDGKTIVWQNYAYITQMNSATPHFSLEELVGNPKALQSAFEAAAKITIKEMLDILESDLTATATISPLGDNGVRQEEVLKPKTTETKPVQQAGQAPKTTEKKMRQNPVTGEMEEETNCNGWCGLKDGFKFDNKNPLFD